MKKIGKLKHRTTALLMSFLMALGLIAPAFSVRVKAEALEVMNSACTVADMVFSYCAAGGVAVMNETVIDEVYNTFGSSFGTLQTFVDNGLLTYSNGQYVDTGLSTSIESTLQSVQSIDLGSLFSQTAEQNPAGVALSGAGSLAGIAGSVATSGVLPVVAGVAVTGYCGFQIGTLIANFLGLYEKPMEMGIPLNTKEEALNYIPAGSDVAYAQDANGRDWYFYGQGIPFSFISNPNQGYVDVGIYNNTTNSLIYNYMHVDSNNNLDKSSVSVSSHNDKRFSFRTNNYRVKFRLDSYNEYLSERDKWNRNIFDNEISGAPDVIGPNGNTQGNYDNNQYNFPDVQPQVNPETQSINPSGLGRDDWLNYANNTDANYNNGNPELNSDLFDDILDAIRINTPTPAPTPVPQPEPYPDLNPNPETVPVTVPTVNPYPNTYPVADPESVPDNREQPEYTEKPTENETDITTGDPYTTPDLLDKFPFCIPRDILRAFKKLDSGSREAPHIQWRFHPNEKIDYTFDVDFAVWENIASLLRLLELIAFVVALGIATRNLILS